VWTQLGWSNSLRRQALLSLLLLLLLLLHSALCLACGA
jgi:hypothetical protein